MCSYTCFGLFICSFFVFFVVIVIIFCCVVVVGCLVCGVVSYLLEKIIVLI